MGQLSMSAGVCVAGDDALHGECPSCRTCSVLIKVSFQGSVPQAPDVCVLVCACMCVRVFVLRMCMWCVYAHVCANVCARPRVKRGASMGPRCGGFQLSNGCSRIPHAAMHSSTAIAGCMVHGRSRLLPQLFSW